MPTVPFPFFVGCGRSGTTLLRALVDGHPDMAVPPESHFIVPLARHLAPGAFDAGSFLDHLYASERFGLWELDRTALEASFGDSPPDDYAGAVRAVFALWAARRGKERYADKTPVYVLHVASLARLFPEAVFVHLVRDGRDVAASFLELGWAATVEEAAFHWQLRVQRGRRAGRSLPAGRYHELRYEDLVRDPESSLRWLCQVMGLPFEAAMLDHEHRAAEVVRTTSHPSYHRNLAGPVARHVRDWRRDLSRDQVARFELSAGRLLDDLGYERSGGRPSARVRCEVAVRRARWQLHRLTQKAGLQGG